MPQAPPNSIDCQSYLHLKEVEGHLEDLLAVKQTSSGVTSSLPSASVSYPISPDQERTVTQPEHPCCVFSPDNRPDPKPPEVDVAERGVLDPCSNLLLQMFMAELDSATGLEEEEGVPSLPVPEPTPVPSPFSPSHDTVTLECTNLTGLDDPFLAEFTDIDALLQDTNLIPSSVSNIPSPSNYNPSPDNAHSAFVNSECVSLPQDASLSPFSGASSCSESGGLTFTFSGDALLENPEVTSPPLQQDSVQHGHAYTESTVVSARKRRASGDGAESLNTQATKKPKPIVKNDKYFHRRHKNNVASQVSRSKRKSKHASMFDRVVELERENESLRARVEEMTAEAERLKKLLINRLAQ